MAHELMHFICITSKGNLMAQQMSAVTAETIQNVQETTK